MSADGVSEMLTASIRSCDCGIYKDLQQNIVLSGGTTLYQGLQERLQMEMENLCPSPGWKTKVGLLHLIMFKPR